MVTFKVLTVICALANPADCKEIIINTPKEITPFECMRYSQVEAAKHRGYFVKRMECTRVKGSLL